MNPNFRKPVKNDYKFDYNKSFKSIFIFESAYTDFDVINFPIDCNDNSPIKLKINEPFDIRKKGIAEIRYHTKYGCVYLVVNIVDPIISIENDIIIINYSDIQFKD